MKIYFLFFAIVLFFLLRFISRILNSIQAKKSIHKLLIRIFPLVEFSIWLAFGYWTINHLLSNSQYYYIIVFTASTCIAIIASWYFLRDFIAGIILKTEIPFEINQRIRVPLAEGILRKLGYRSLEIESDTGEITKVPYSQITANAIHLQNIDDSMQGQEALISINPKIPIQEVKDKIVQEILLLPWSSIKHQPSVKLVEQGIEKNIYSVHFYSITDRHAAHICQYLQKCFDEVK